MSSLVVLRLGLAVALALALALASTAKAQFNGCLPGFCGPLVQGSGPPPPVCTPGGPTGQMDFSLCSNIGITAVVL